MHYLLSVNLSKSFAQLNVSLFNISRYFQHFSNRFCPVAKSGVTSHCLHRNSLTLVSWTLTKSKFLFINLTSWIMICCSQDHQIDSSYLISRFITKKIVQLIRSYIVQSINVILKQIVFDGTKIPSNMADYLPIW